MSSEMYQNLFSALVKAQGQMDKLIANSTAAIKSDKASYSYKYADLADVLRVALKTLSANELGVIQIPEVQFMPDGTVVSISATLFHASGEFMPIAPLCLRIRANATAQEIGSCVTYARRYQLQSVLGMAADDDDGAAAQSSQGQSASKRQQVPPQPAHRALPPPSTGGRVRVEDAPPQVGGTQTERQAPPADGLPTSLDELPELAPTPDENPFNGAPPVQPVKVGQITEAQLGVALYGSSATWDAKRPGIVDATSSHRTKSSKELWQAEAQTLITVLEKRVVAEAKRIAKPLVDSGQTATVDEIDQAYGVELAQSLTNLRKVIEQAQPVTA